MPICKYLGGGQHRVDVDDGATRVAVGGVTSVTAISAIYAHICITASRTRLGHQLLVIPLAHLHTSCPHWHFQEPLMAFSQVKLFDPVSGVMRRRQRDWSWTPDGGVIWRLADEGSTRSLVWILESRLGSRWRVTELANGKPLRSLNTFTGGFFGDQKVLSE